MSSTKPSQGSRNRTDIISGPKPDAIPLGDTLLPSAPYRNRTYFSGFSGQRSTNELRGQLTLSFYLSNLPLITIIILPVTRDTQSDPISSISFILMTFIRPVIYPFWIILRTVFTLSWFPKFSLNPIMKSMIPN